MRLVFAGTPAVAVPSLKALLASDHEVVAVLTRPDARAGRGRAMAASPVKQAAIQAGIPVLESIRDAAALQQLLAYRPQVGAVVAYGQLLSPQVLAAIPAGWINLHFSLLPAWRGAAPVQQALLAGDEITGATTFQLEADLDSGPILGTVTELIGPQDTTGTLLERLGQSGAGLLRASLDGLADGSLAAVPQPAHGISFAPKLSKSDAAIRWRAPAPVVDRQIRACTPQPGAWSTLHGQVVKLGPARLLSPPEQDLPRPLAPGELQVAKDAVYVGTLNTPLLLGTVRPAGKSEMSAPDWARGARLPSAIRFEEPS